MFAPVVPPQLLLEMKNANLFGKYHLLLAHDIVAQKEIYQEIFKDRRRGDGIFVILDNSLIELGYPAPPKTIAEAAEIVKPDCLVLPDELNNMNTTLELSDEAINEWRGMDLPPFLGVVQGKNIGEYLECAKKFISMGVDYISVPRIATEILGSRKSLIEAIYNSYKISMHLLGFSNVRCFDDIAATKCKGVMGIDSAVPIRLAYQGDQLNLKGMQNIGGRGNYWETCLKLTPLITYNLGKADGWFGDLHNNE